MQSLLQFIIITSVTAILAYLIITVFSFIYTTAPIVFWLLIISITAFVISFIIDSEKI